MTTTTLESTMEAPRDMYFERRSTERPWNFDETAWSNWPGLRRVFQGQRESDQRERDGVNKEACDPLTN